MFGCLDVWTGELGYVNEGERRERAQSVHGREMDISNPET